MKNRSNRPPCPPHFRTGLLRLAFAATGMLASGILASGLLGGCAEEPKTFFDWGVNAPSRSVARDAAPAPQQEPPPPPLRTARVATVDVAPADPLPTVKSARKTAPRTNVSAETHLPPSVAVGAQTADMPQRLARNEAEGQDIPAVVPKRKPHNEMSTSAAQALSAATPSADTDAEALPRLRPKPGTAQGDTAPQAAQTPLQSIDDVLPRLRPDPDAAVSPADDEAAPADKPVKGTGRFYWPANGPIVSDFGSTADGQRNDGINIAVHKNAPIYAAAAGTVVYVGDGVKGFGNLMLIRHADGYVTAYAHAARFTVKAGAKVAAGQIIGHCGQSGDVTTPQLHFEVRQNVHALDPKPFLAAKG